jgi:GNAT superfamily N-acetyltransferase
MDRETFTQNVYKNWAEHLHCTVEDFHSPATVLQPNAEHVGSAAIHTWTIDRRAFAQMDPALETEMANALGDRCRDTALTAELLRAALAPGRVARAEDNVLRSRSPPDFTPAFPAAPYAIRTLTAADADALAALKATCTPIEVETGEVSVEDEIGFGCFDGPRMVSIATGFRLYGFMDIGVLTDPACRRKGLGKATVSALCAWCIEAPIIAQYRCDVTNTGSDATARALGFSLPITQQSIYLTPLA